MTGERPVWKFIAANYGEEECSCLGLGDGNRSGGILRIYYMHIIYIYNFNATIPTSWMWDLKEVGSRTTTKYWASA